MRAAARFLGITLLGFAMLYALLEFLSWVAA